MSNMALRRTMNNVGFFFKKNAPAIMTGVGVVATVSAVGLVAYNSYKKLPKIVENHKEKLNEIDESGYSVDRHRSETIKAYGSTALSLAKTYALPAALLAGGITAIVGSDKIQTKRFNEVSAALGITAAAYDELKKRVAGEIGEEKLQDILMGADPKDKGKEFETVDPETGEIKKEKCKAYDRYGALSMYAIQFNKVNAKGEYCNRNCKGEPYYDNWFINRVESMLNDKLMIRGEDGLSWLSEAYADLGATVSNGCLTKEQDLASRVVGFRYNPDKPIRLKLVERYYDRDHARQTPDLWIDFLNIDGNLYNDIHDKVYNKKA